MWEQQHCADYVQLPECSETWRTKSVYEVELKTVCGVLFVCILLNVTNHSLVTNSRGENKSVNLIILTYEVLLTEYSLHCKYI